MKFLLHKLENLLQGTEHDRNMWSPIKDISDDK